MKSPSAAAIERMFRSADGGNAADITGGDPGEDRYQEQYGVIVVCESQAEQQLVNEDLQGNGYTCKVVCA